MQNSTSGSGRRLATAIFLGAASTAMVAGSAHADGGIKGASVDPAGDKDAGTVALTGGGNAGTFETVLIALKPKGGDSDLLTYCIQQTVTLNASQLYDEADWAKEAARIHISPAHLQGIKWILNHSVPQISTTALASASNAAHDPVVNLSETEAVEATQAAIWAMADPTGALKINQTAQKSADGDDNVYQLFTYLTGAASTGGTVQQQASLNIVPAQTSAPHAGDKLGFKLVSTDTTDQFISVGFTGDASGAKLVDGTGKAIGPTDTFKSGTTVYVQLPTKPANGTVTLHASGIANGIEAGRVFVSENQTTPGQNLILAQTSSAPVAADAGVSWTTVVTPPTSPSSSSSSSPTSHPSSSHPSTSPSSTSPSTTPSSTPTSTAGTTTTTPSSTPTEGTTTSTSDTDLAHTGAGNTMAIGGGALALVAAGGGMVVYTRRRKAGQQGTHS
ncbi:MAG: Cys-Gln thioester bond-forming surface protein [Catenulispora sp.]|nr:Cys-Gln thioester bond-forming surface protein [Catenulispora sp.]